MYKCGLKEYIHVKLKLYKPQTIKEVIDATKLIEHKQKFKLSSFKEVEDQQQYASKKESNKYRYCGDKWTSGHRCLNKKLYAYEVEKESITSSNESKKRIKKEK